MSVLSFPSAGLRTAYASELGCVLDGLTNDSMQINTWLSNASATNPLRLIMDGMAATNGIIISAAGYTTIEGLGKGTGFTLLNGSTPAAIYISGNTSEGAFGVPPAQSAQYITVRNLDISPAAGTTGAYGILLASCGNVLIDNVQIQSPGLYCACVSNASDVRVSRCSFYSSANIQDGVHVDGPATRVNVAHCTFATGDDSIALNCPEGYGGNITECVVSDCIFNNSWTVMRIYTSLRATAGDTFYAKQIVVANCVGSTAQCAFNLGIEATAWATPVDQIQDVLITGCDIRSPNGLAVMRTPFGTYQFRDCIFRAPTTITPAILVGTPGGGDLALLNFTVLRNADGTAAPPIVVVGGASLNRLTIDGFRVDDMLTSGYTAIPYVLDVQQPGSGNNSTLSSLRIYGADMNHVSSLLSSAGSAGISLISGPGVTVNGSLVTVL